MKAARHLLVAERPVAEVATDVGFCGEAHFTRHFHWHISITQAR